MATKNGLTKRLERGTFSWPRNVQPQMNKLRLTPQALAMLTDGVDLRGAKLRPWYEREARKIFSTGLNNS